MDETQTMATEGIADKIFFGCILVLTIIGRIFMGCELDLKVVRSALRKPVAPIIGLCSQFFFMPLLAFFFAKTLLAGQKPYVMFGLLVMGCVPGGDASNFWTYMLGANVNLSVTMTFISTLASLFMTTMWIKLLGPQLFSNGVGEAAKPIVMNIPYNTLLLSLFFLTLPTIIGIVIARCRPVWAEQARKALRPLIYVIVVFSIVFGGLLYHRIFFQEITWQALLAGFLLPFFGFYAGFLAAHYLGQRMEDVIAISIETGVQNMPIALAVLKISFPEWGADQRLLQPVLVGAFTPLPILLCFVLQQIYYHYVCPRASPTVQMEDVKAPIHVVVQKKLPHPASEVNENVNMIISWCPVNSRTN